MPKKPAGVHALVPEPRERARTHPYPPFHREQQSRHGQPRFAGSLILQATAPAFCRTRSRSEIAKAPGVRLAILKDGPCGGRRTLRVRAGPAPRWCLLVRLAETWSACSCVGL